MTDTTTTTPADIVHPFANQICYVCGRGFEDAREAIRHLLRHPGRAQIELTAGSLLDALDGTPGKTTTSAPPALTHAEVDALQDAETRAALATATIPAAPAPPAAVEKAAPEAPAETPAEDTTTAAATAASSSPLPTESASPTEATTPTTTN